jgi:hypothetical protein
MFFRLSAKQLFTRYPTNGANQGWTFINLKEIRKDMFVDALTMAWLQVAPKKIASLIKTDSKNK